MVGSSEAIPSPATLDIIPVLARHPVQHRFPLLVLVIDLDIAIRFFASVRNPETSKPAWVQAHRVVQLERGVHRCCGIRRFTLEHVDFAFENIHARMGCRDRFSVFGKVGRRHSPRKWIRTRCSSAPCSSKARHTGLKTSRCPSSRWKKSTSTPSSTTRAKGNTCDAADAGQGSREGTRRNSRSRNKCFRKQLPYRLSSFPELRDHRSPFSFRLYACLLQR